MSMFQVRFHGRGGQGAVTAAELLSVAAFLEGKYAQAVPSFGPERTGAPVTAYCRIADEPIRSHEPIVEPDAVVVQDASLLRSVDVFAGLAEHGTVLVNAHHTIEHAVTVDASEIAQRALGKPIPNAALLGALVGLTHIVSIDSLATAIERHFVGATREGNLAAARAGFDRMSSC